MERVAEIFGSVHERRPQDDDIAVRLAKTWTILGRSLIREAPERAESLARQAITLLQVRRDRRPDHLDLHQQLLRSRLTMAEIALARSDFESADQAVEEVLREDLEHDELRFGLAYSLTEMALTLTERSEGSVWSRWGDTVASLLDPLLNRDAITIDELEVWPWFQPAWGEHPACQRLLERD